MANVTQKCFILVIKLESLTIRSVPTKSLATLVKPKILFWVTAVILIGVVINVKLLT